MLYETPQPRPRSGWDSHGRCALEGRGLLETLVGMRKTKEEKRKAKRKTKKRESRQISVRVVQKEDTDFFLHEAFWHWDRGRLDKALPLLQKVVRLNPRNEQYLMELGRLGHEMGRPDVEIKALHELYHNGLMMPGQTPLFCDLLARSGEYEKALGIIEETLPIIPKIRVRGKKAIKDTLLQIRQYCLFRLENEPRLDEVEKKSKAEDRQVESPRVAAQTMGTPPSEDHTKVNSFPEIPVTVTIDLGVFQNVLADARFATPEKYELALEGHRIRFREAFETLISLHTLHNVRSFWYQEETARKVLRTYRGRALLADEVGLGKTIEALIILKEYIQRGMVKSALILTPAPLVSQWKEELKTKFGLDFPSTDDPDYRGKGASLWKKPFALASINTAKSRRNFQEVTEREYDIVIVDEAHHLKNRNTLNWKLVNALKNRFLLFLTATPVENNLMELYNLVTLLKPGQLKTVSSFRERFMTRGDPTDPQNRSQLRELLNQVMIRNTRALARIDIPARFAQTNRIEPHPLEIELYERISALVRSVNASEGVRQRLLLKNLLEEAGSSTRAVRHTLGRMLDRSDDPLVKEYERQIRLVHDLCRSGDESGKDKFLLGLVKGSPDKIIVFVKYLGTLEHVSEFLARHGLPHALFHGRMNNREKDEQIEHFRKETDILVTTEIGGEGRNLQFCHQMVNYDLTWNPMKIEQRIGRIHRIGQEKEVMIYNLCAAGSIEDYILQILDKKINMFEMVIGEIDMILGRIEGEQEFSDRVYDIWANANSAEEMEKGFNQLGAYLRKAKASYEKTKDLDRKLFGEDYEL